MNRWDLDRALDAVSNEIEALERVRREVVSKRSEPKMTYVPEQGISEAVFNESGLFSGDPDRYSCEDLIHRLAQGDVFRSPRGGEASFNRFQREHLDAMGEGLRVVFGNSHLWIAIPNKTNWFEGDLFKPAGDRSQAALLMGQLKSCFEIVEELNLNTRIGIKNRSLGVAWLSER